MSINTEGELYHQLLERAARDQGSVDLSAQPGSDRLRQLVTEWLAINKQVGVDLITNEQILSLVAVGQSGDPVRDDAYLRLVRRVKSVADAAVSPQVFENLNATGTALASVEAAATPLSLGFLQAVLDYDAHNRGVNQMIADLLSQPDDTVLAPGITVGTARTLLADVTLERQRQAGLKQGRQTKDRRHAAALSGKVSAAEKALADEQAVEKLRRLAAGDGDPLEAAAALPAADPAADDAAGAAARTGRKAKR